VPSHIGNPLDREHRRSSRCLGYCDADQHQGQHATPEYPADSSQSGTTPVFARRVPPAGSSRRVFLLTVVIVADHPGLASSPQFINADNIGVLEHITDAHIDPRAWRRFTKTPQKFFDEPLSFMFLGQVGISPVICVAEAPPRLCDPPCSEKQAGIGPISQKPELLTMIKTYSGRRDGSRTYGPPSAAIDSHG
jgi:hypothetical protein